MHILQITNLCKELGIPLLVVFVAILVFFQLAKFLDKRNLKKNIPLTPTTFPSILDNEELSEVEEIKSPVEKIAEEFDIDPWRVKVALNIPFSKQCNANSVADAENAYYEAERGSEEGIVAFLRWIELENSVTAMSKIFDLAKGSKFHEDCVLKKWDELAKKIVANATYEGDIINAFYDTPEGSESEKEVISKLYALYTK